MILFRLKSLYC